MPAVPMHAPAGRPRPSAADREARREAADLAELAGAEAGLAEVMEAHRYILLAVDAYGPVGDSDALSDVEIALTEAQWKLARLQRDRAARLARRR